MQNLRVQLRAVFYKDGKDWVAHCLEMDLMGHARTRRQAFKRMNAAIALQIDNSLAHDNPANIFQPADAKYFQMYAAGKDAMDGSIEFQPIACGSPSGGIVVEGPEAREYACA